MVGNVKRRKEKKIWALQTVRNKRERIRHKDVKGAKNILNRLQGEEREGEIEETGISLAFIPNAGD